MSLDAIKQVAALPPAFPNSACRASLVPTHLSYYPSTYVRSQAQQHTDILTQKVTALRQEQEETEAKYNDVQAKTKVLEQENLAKEQEITSLTHKNGLLEATVEKLENDIKEHKMAAQEISQHRTQNESLQRKLQLLDQEAEESDKNLRETNEKYAIQSLQHHSVVVVV